MQPDQIAFTGIGESKVGETPKKSSLNLYADACRAAIDDAGLKKSDIDGVLSAYSLVEPKLMHSTVLSDYLGIQPAVNSSLDVGGATPFVGVCHAANAIAQGTCENVLVAFGDNRKTGFQGDEAQDALTNIVGHPEFEDPHGPTVPALYALLAKRYIDKCDVTEEDFAKVSVTCREHAAKRGEGQLTEPVEVQDVLDSPPVSEPLKRMDCALISDGAGAVVVSSAAEAGTSRDPVRLAGYGQGHGSEYLTRRGPLLKCPARASGRAAFSSAGFDPEDIDVAQFYDCFSFTPLILLEDLGFCEKGDGGRFVREEGIGLGDTLPINTHGGLLSYAGAGVFHIIEAIRQLRGSGGATQVDDADTALAHGLGGILSTHATLIMEAW